MCSAAVLHHHLPTREHIGLVRGEKVQRIDLVISPDLNARASASTTAEESISDVAPQMACSNESCPIIYPCSELMEFIPPERSTYLGDGIDISAANSLRDSRGGDGRLMISCRHYRRLGDPAAIFEMATARRIRGALHQTPCSTCSRVGDHHWRELGHACSLNRSRLSSSTLLGSEEA